MPINFFDAGCKTESNITKFGLCDDPPNHPLPDTPAYIDEYDTSKWISIVNNPTEKKADFYAIDNCVTILKPDGISMESRCDGMLHYDNTVLFVELKMRGGSGWLSKARTQLTITIDKFKTENPLVNFDKVEAHACNGLKPAAITGNNTEIEKFKIETGGLILNAGQNINI
jgi:hypothetical protein